MALSQRNTSGLFARRTVEFSGSIESGARDGAFIVRNCGPTHPRIRALDAAVDGPSEFLSDDKFPSSPPGSGAGGLGLTFCERN